MGTLQTTIILRDKFSDQLNKINKSIQNTTNNMSRLNKSNASSVKSVNGALSQQISYNNTILKQMGRWATQLRNVATIYFGIRGAIQTINKTIQLSDKMTMTDAKLNLVAGGDKKLKNELEAKTFAASQRSTTDYMEFSKAVGKLGVLAGDKFKNNDSIVKFVELMNKSFQISGAETSERNAAMLQITQAIASNRLQGDEFRSILENAPMVMQALTKSLGVGHDQLKKMAKDGKITADVLIKAMFDAGDKIEEMYKTLPMTWERHWAKLKNVGVMAFKPIHEQFERLFNSEKFQKFINGIGTAMIVLGNVVGWALGKILNFVNWVSDGFVKLINWTKNMSGVFSFLRNVIVALTIATAIYGVVWAIVHLRQILAVGATILLIGLLLSFITVVLAVATVLSIVCGVWWLITNATKIATMWSAIWSFITTYHVWIVIGVIALLILWFYKCSDGWIDTISRMVGGLYWFWESLKWLWECVKVIGKNIGIAFNNGWSNALSGFWKFIKGCLEGVKSLEPVINAVAKAFGAEGFTISGAITNIDGKIRKAESMHKNYESLPVFNGSAAYEKGYKKSEKTLNKVADNIGNLGDKISDLTKVTVGGDKLTAEALNGMNDKLGDVGGNTGDTAKNTGETAKNTSSSNDYSYLRDWSYARGMGSSIGYNIKIEQNNQNKIGNNMDLNRVIDAVRDAIIEGIYNGAEGVRG